MKLAFGTTGLVGDPSRSDGQQVLQAPRMPNSELPTQRASALAPEANIRQERGYVVKYL